MPTEAREEEGHGLPAFGHRYVFLLFCYHKGTTDSLVYNPICYAVQSTR